MAAFPQHLAVSGGLGVCYSAALMATGAEWTHALLAGGLCTIVGMLPDLDSGSSKPVQEFFGLAAAVLPLMILHRLERLAESAEGGILLAALVYLLIRFGGPWLLDRLTVHRGMFHSIPAAIIAAALAYLAHDCPHSAERVMMAGGVLLGFLSHLVLDEVSSVDLAGLRVKSSWGSALKLYSNNRFASFFAWCLVVALGVLVVRQDPEILRHLQQASAQVMRYWESPEAPPPATAPAAPSEVS